MGIPTVALRASSQALAVCCLTLWSQSSTACSCLQDASPPEQQVRSAFRDMDYVATIEIKSSKITTIRREEYVSDWNPETQQSEESKRTVTERLLVARFTPLHIYKGDKSARAVNTRADSAACGVVLEPGSRYLVYAYGPEESNNQISTGSCTRTALLEKATADIAVLDALTKPVSVVQQASGAQLRFNEALELIHSSSDGDEGFLQAMTIADELAESDPLSGFSQALQAEIRSTWELADDGSPVESQVEILALADTALRIAPGLAQAHVAKARTYNKASKLKEAEEAIQAALRIDPQLPSAIFVQAEIYRRQNDSAKADSWMRNYIAVVNKPVQKANGHEWMAKLSRDIAYHPQAVNREMHLLLAGVYFKSAVDLDPANAERLIRYATFLNEYVADFAAAETYASKALALDEHPFARYHLAAARYQALQAKAAEMELQALRTAIAEIGASTGVSLDEAANVGIFHDVIHARLLRLQRRAQSPAQ